MSHILHIVLSKLCFLLFWVVGVGVTREKPTRSTVAVESRSEFNWYLPQEDANIIPYLNRHSCQTVTQRVILAELHNNILPPSSLLPPKHAHSFLKLKMLLYLKMLSEDYPIPIDHPSVNEHTPVALPPLRTSRIKEGPCVSWWPP